MTGFAGPVVTWNTLLRKSCRLLEFDLILGSFGMYSQMVRIFILALLAFALCSCADSYEILGLHLKPAANGDYDNAGHVPGSGDPS